MCPPQVTAVIVSLWRVRNCYGFLLGVWASSHVHYRSPHMTIVSIFFALLWNITEGCFEFIIVSSSGYLHKWPIKRILLSMSTPEQEVNKLKCPFNWRLVTLALDYCVASSNPYHPNSSLIFRQTNIQTSWVVSKLVAQGTWKGVRVIYFRLDVT